MSGVRFATRGFTRQVLHDYALGQFFLSSLALPIPPVTETLFAERVGGRELYDFLTTLIFVGCSAEGLAGGLHFIYEEMRTQTLEKLVCYHMKETWYSQGANGTIISRQINESI